MHAQDLGPAVVREIDEVVGDQTIVQRDDDRAELRHGVILLEVLMGVRRERGHTVALPDPELCQGGRPLVATLTEFCIRQPQLTINDGLAGAMQLARPAQEVERSERGFHAACLAGAGARF
jgi:hypothetical protein